MNDSHPTDSGQPANTFSDITFVSERTLALCGQALREMYDELFELDMSQNRYKTLFLRQGKYMSLPPKGVWSDAILDFSETMIHPADCVRFLAFFDLERIRKAFASGARSLSVEFRQRRVNKCYEWVQANLLPATGVDEDILICSILDINQRKRMEENNAMMQEICRVAISDECEFLCLIQVSTRSYTTYKFDRAFDICDEQGDYDAFIRMISLDVSDEDRQVFLDAALLDRVLEKLDHESTQHVISYRIKRNGVWQWYCTRMSYFRNNCDMILCTIRNITDVYEAKEKQNYLQQQFLHVFGSIYTDIVEIDPLAGSGLVMKSHFAPHMVNTMQSFDFLADFFLRERVHEDEQLFVAQNLSQKELCSFLQSGVGQKTFEIHYKTDGNRYDWMELSIFSIAGPPGVSSKVLLTVCNINERKLLKHIADRFIYKKYDYLICVDAYHDRYFVYSNYGGKQIPENVKGYTETVASYNQSVIAAEDVEKINQAMHLDVVLEKLETSDEYSFFISTIENGVLHRKRIQYVYFDKDSHQILLSSMDVTDVYEEEQRKNAFLKDALHHAETANRAKTDFLSRMSHDIRTPMNAIMGMTSIALNRFEQQDRVRDCLRKIESSSQYLLSLLNDVLDMSRIESGAMTIVSHPFSFEGFVRGFMTIVQQQADAKHVNITTTVDDSVAPHYRGDVLRLNQIVLNLVSNAIKYTPENGCVTIHVRELELHMHKPVLEMQVSDTGCGMSSEFMQRMFEPFEQETNDIARNQVGSGLGLPIVQHLVRLMGGSVSVRSERGKGTVFTITFSLERVDEHGGTGLRRIQNAAVHLQGMRVLIVDDDPVSCEHASILFEELGCHTNCQTSGRGALAHLEACVATASATGLVTDAVPAAGRLPYPLVLVDWRMPGLSGLETIRRLRARWEHQLQIVIMSAYDRSRIEYEALPVGVDGFLSKPLSRRAVAELLDSLYPAATSCAEEKMHGLGQRILVVEDNDINMEIACDLLEQAHMLSDRAENGRIAVDMFSASAPGCYGAILMDIRMPVMDGLEATRIIRALEHPDAHTVAIIGLSANVFQEDITTAIAAGMDCYLIKPIHAQSLHEALTQWIGAREPLLLTAKASNSRL